MHDFWISLLIQVSFFAGSFILSTVLLRLFIIRPQRKEKEKQAEKTGEDKRKGLLHDTGFWIGFFEHIIIFIFVANKEFSALAIIFGAKEFVRKEDIVKNPAYYLLGTLLNFGIALIAVELYLKLYPC